MGPYPDLSVRDARKIAREFKALMAKGIDPREVRHKNYIEENEKCIKKKR
ncbi:Arm DNA-binding domain-containing protein [Candidatus Orientia mediorientalis]